MGRLDDGDFDIAPFRWAKRHTHALFHSWKHTIANKSDIVLGWIGFYDELIFQILAHLWARKLAQVNTFFWSDVALCTCFYTYIILCRFYKVLSRQNFRKPIKSCCDFFASCMTKKFLNSAMIWTHCQETKGMQCIFLWCWYKQPNLSLKSLFRILSYSLSCYCYSCRCSDCAATVTGVSNLFRESSYWVVHPKNFMKKCAMRLV